MCNALHSMQVFAGVKRLCEFLRSAALQLSDLSATEVRQAAQLGKHSTQRVSGRVAGNAYDAHGACHRVFE